MSKNYRRTSRNSITCKTFDKTRKFTDNLQYRYIFCFNTIKNKILTIKNKNIDGLLGCFESNDENLSFIKLNEKGFVEEVKEKEKYQIMHQQVCIFLQEQNNFLKR